MIRGFKDRMTQRFFSGIRVQKFQGFADQATRRLIVLDSAESLQDLKALRSNRQWRICFSWGDDGPHSVEIVDYH
jgi:proteic killer suppression protein